MPLGVAVPLAWRALAVVLDREADARRLRIFGLRQRDRLDAQAHRLGVGVLGGIGEPFLSDAENVDGSGVRQWRQLAGDVQLEARLAPRAGAPHVDELLQALGQPEPLEVGRAQVEQRCAQRLQEAHGDVGQALRLRTQLRAVLARRLFDGGGKCGHGRQVLAERVVQLAGEPAALLLLRIHEPARRAPPAQPASSRSSGRAHW